MSTPFCCLFCVLSCSVMSDSATPQTIAHQAPLSMGILQARILEWVAMSCFLQDLPNPGIESRSPALQADSLPVEPPGSPRILEWVVYSFSRRSSQPRNRTGFSCIAGGFFTSWAMREALFCSLGEHNLSASCICVSQANHPVLHKTPFYFNQVCVSENLIKTRNVDGL